ncbi:MAG: rod shape-determining protein [bacterium]|nr:rod shape-determining protein [bacterium]
MLRIFQKNIGIDLGTANTRVYLANKGIVLNEPSIVAFNNRTNRVIAVGESARKMFSRTPVHISAVKPLVNSVISDFDITQEMIRQFLKNMPWSLATRIIASIPTNLTEVEQKSVEDIFKNAGASSVFLVPQPVAAALGSRLEINEPTARLIVDIGAGVTGVAILSMNGLVVSERLKVAGDQFNEEIIKFVRDEFKLIIGEPTAEEIKLGVGSAMPQSEKLEVVARGRDISSGLPKEIVVKDTQIRAALNRSLRTIAETVKKVIESAPAELVGDIYKNGIYLCGGGSLLRGIDEFFRKEIAVNVQIVDDPLNCLVRGTGLIAENFEKYQDLLLS